MSRRATVVFSFIVIIAWVLATVGCEGYPPERAAEPPEEAMSDIEKRLAKYTTVTLNADLDVLTPDEKKLIPLLIEAARIMDELFWYQAYGDRDVLLASIENPDVRRFVEINYGPWDRLEANTPFIEGVGPKPKGANFYPKDMTVEEFEAAMASGPVPQATFDNLFTFIYRKEDGALEARFYHDHFRDKLRIAAAKLREAAAFADPEFARYLELRADALLSSRYRQSDLAWMDMKDNTVDLVIGPIETYEDQLFGYKASFEAYVLIKDKEWSRRLERYAAFLPELQRGLPVPDDYKQETPGTDSDLNAYDVVYYAGDCNAGSKTIAINLPNDEQVQLEKGTRRLQLKNAMKAKFDEILVPISKELIAEDQRGHITFDAFFTNTMFHEVAHGLGIKRTLDGSSTVRQALKEQSSGLEEGKADILGLYMVTRLHEKGELGEVDLRDNYVTFMASVFRSTRFGASSAHGRANLSRFNFFEEMGAFTRDDATGTYRVDFDRMEEAMNALTEKILRLQGDGDWEGARAFMATYGQVDAVLQGDLDRLSTNGIPVDIVFEQGPEVLGL
jgi:hypothetical protein